MLSSYGIYQNIYFWPEACLLDNSGKNLEQFSRTERSINVWYLRLGVIWMLLPKLNFLKGHWAIGYFFTHIWDLSCFVTHEATRIPSLLYQISRFALLVTNRICIKTFCSYKILWPGPELNGGVNVSI